MRRRARQAAARTAVLSLLLAIAGLSSVTAADFVINNADGAGEGFNDLTPVSPVGGNPGTTLGQQRLNVFQRTAEIWGSVLVSDVPIRVEAAFDPLTCNSTSAVLGSAGTKQVVRNFLNAPQSGTWYHTALANALAGSDLIPGSDDISATFNSAIDNNNNCLTGTNWYLGFDNNPGAGISLLDVLLHEFAHGLGFSGFVNLSNGRLLQNTPDVFAAQTLDISTGLNWTQMSNGQRRNSATNTGNVVWSGLHVGAAAASTLVSGTDASGNVRLYAPSPVDIGSSIYHYDVVVSPNVLMEPFINSNIGGQLDLTDELMRDIGWELFARGDVNGDGRVDIVDWLLVQQSVNDQASLSPREFLRADMYPDSGDDDVDISDLTRLEERLTQP